MKRKAIVVSAFLCLNLISGCGGDIGNAPSGAAAFTTMTSAGNPSTEQTLPFDLVATVGNHAAGTFVLRSEAELSQFIMQSSLLASKPPAIPVVDFTKKYVVAVVETVGGGSSFSVTAVKSSAKGITVDVTRVLPGPSCIVSQIAFNVGQLITVPIFEGDVTIEATDTTKDSCQ